MNIPIGGSILPPVENAYLTGNPQVTLCRCPLSKIIGPVQMGTRALDYGQGFGTCPSNYCDLKDVAIGCMSQEYSYRQLDMSSGF